VQAARSGSHRKHFANCWMMRVRNSKTRQLLPPRLVPVSLVKPTRRPERVVRLRQRFTMGSLLVSSQDA
jgi:hypothetical protein